MYFTTSPKSLFTGSQRHAVDCYFHLPGVSISRVFIFIQFCITLCGIDLLIQLHAQGMAKELKMVGDGMEDIDKVRVCVCDRAIIIDKSVCDHSSRVDLNLPNQLRRCLANWPAPRNSSQPTLTHTGGKSCIPGC